MAAHEGVELQTLFDAINDSVNDAKKMLVEIKEKKNDEISIGQMFEMQYKMNTVSQFSELCTSVVAATHQALHSMARNVK